MTQNPNDLEPKLLLGPNTKIEPIWKHIAVTYKKGITTLYIDDKKLNTHKGESTFEIWYPQLDIRLSKIAREIK